MKDYEDALKQKKWNELKAAVGTMVMQEGKGEPKSLADLLMNLKDVSLDSFVCQTDIQSEEDKNLLRANGYEVSLTEDEFKQKFPIDPSCIWYTPSIAQSCLYFNHDTLAAVTFPIQLYEVGVYKDTGILLRVIREREEEAAKNEFMGSVLTFPDAARMEYFNLLVEKKGNDIPDLYDLFFSIYVDNDYGFGKIKPETLRTILDSKTEEDRARTAEKLREYP